MLKSFSSKKKIKQQRSSCHRGADKEAESDSEGRAQVLQEPAGPVWVG